MPESTPEQLRFPPVAGLSVRADFDGGTLSSDFGPMILRGIDRRIGLTEWLSAAFDDRRHPSYINHPLRDLTEDATHGLIGASPAHHLCINRSAG
ncbi:MAG: transposase [Thiohalocapsa sp.]